MTFNTQFVDKMAISLSSLCVAHCLIFPMLVLLIPSISGLGLASESFHLWMVISVLPTSILALTMGCKKHSKISVVIIGALGLSCLLLALTPASTLFNALDEKVLTLIGAFFISTAHIINFKLCKKKDSCKGCTE